MAITTPITPGTAYTSGVGSSAVTLTYGGTPQELDWQVILAHSIDTDGTVTNGADFDGGTPAEWTAISGGFYRIWQSGDDTSDGFLNSSTTDKWVFLGCWLVRPSTGFSLSLVSDDSSGGASSASTDTTTFTTTPTTDDVILVSHANDSKQTAWSSWTHGVMSLTERREIWVGSGSPANWSSAGFASGVTTQTARTDANCAHDDTGVDYGMNAIAITETEIPVSYPPYLSPPFKRPTIRM